MARVLWMMALAICVSAAREVNFRACKKVEPGTLKNCKVSTLSVEGCLEPTSWVDEDGAVIEYDNSVDSKKPCRFGVGSVLNFSIHYEPGFNADTVRSQFTLPMLEDCWEDQGSLCPLPRTAIAACEQTKCPLRMGHERILETSLEVRSDVPRRSVNSRKVYQMKWKLWNNRNKKQHCCIDFPVQY